MKRLVTIIGFLLVFFFTTGVASAGVSFGFSFPPVAIGSPVISALAPAYSPYSYPYRSYGYGPGYYRYYGYGPGYYGQRVWVPGYWERVWIAYGWERIWHPGYWAYR
jgi:hypothetical protein